MTTVFKVRFPYEKTGLEILYVLTFYVHVVGASKWSVLALITVLSRAFALHTVSVTLQFEVTFYI